MIENDVELQAAQKYGHFSLTIPIMPLAPKWMPPAQGNFAPET